MILNAILLTVFVGLSSSATVDVIDMQSGPRIYYTGVCEISDCRYGSCEIFNSTTYKCHCLKVGLNF